MRAALQSASRKLERAGIKDAARDARRLLEHVLCVDAATLIRDADEALSPSAQLRFKDLVDRRAEREPVSRILGVREFYGRPFLVTPDVLDPRPDTETLIDLALSIIRVERSATGPVSILDLGTGSGAILLTLLAECHGAKGTGTDVSVGALAVAARNAAALGMTDRVTLIEHDTRLSVPHGFDVVVANPPYIPTADICWLDPEVAAHDPHLALDGGPDGLDFYRLIVGHVVEARRVSRQPQWIIFEVGADQSDQVIDISHKNGIGSQAEDIKTARDLAGHVRCVAARTRSPQG